jgi:hypothetical protein
LLCVIIQARSRDLGFATDRAIRFYDDRAAPWGFRAKRSKEYMLIASRARRPSQIPQQVGDL